MSRQAGSPARPNRLRIIGGCWRGRRLDIPDISGLRPTPDRVRETLFNWLAPVIQGARCLDLFAGSGALGLEALSRGAARVTFVERHPGAVRALQANLERLEAQEDGRVIRAEVLDWLGRPAPEREPYHIVFLDPPFRQGLAGPVCAALERGGWLAGEARIYLEEAADQAVDLPETWQVSHHKTAGQVAYRLARCPG